jgi:hypothetical protein
MRNSSGLLVCGIAVVGVFFCAPGRAQQSVPPPEAAPADAPANSSPSAAGATPAPETLSPSAASTESAEPPAGPIAAPVQACVPHCRRGFTCVSGVCVSSCNPPCDIGDVCTEQGECARRPETPLPGDAQAAQTDLGVETHDGFFLRLTTGFGGGAASLDVPDAEEQSYRGGGWNSSIDIGGAAARDLVVFGRLRGAWLFDPKVKIGDRSVSNGGDLVVTQSLLGAGLNYYVMPSNFYFGGVIGFASVGIGRGRRDSDANTQSSDVGLGIDLDAGKEWWVGDNWGIGVTLRLSLASVPAGNDIARDATFGTGFVSVLFSATYQ